METVREDFLVRAREVIAYVRHIGSVAEGPSNSRTIATTHTLRAATYLVTYNLIEATARNAVCAVFDHLQGEGVSFDDVRVELKKMILTHAGKRAADALAQQLRSIATDIFEHAFDEGNIFAGNVDALKLRETAAQIGYSPKTGRASGSVLLTFKANRNDLAHGHKTFSDVGREVSIEQLRVQVAQAIWHMRAVLRNVSEYLEQKRYLASNV